MEALQLFGIEFVKYLQTFHPHLDSIMGVLAMSVKPEYFIVFVMPLLYWNFRQELFIRLFVVMMIDLAIGEILRTLLAQPRPWWIADLVALDPVTSVYSSPGGYSSFAVIFYGYLAYHFKYKWFTAIGIIMILITGVAKMYEAAMLPDHMVLGMLQGGILLYFFTKNEDKLFVWLKQLNFQKVAVLSFIVVSVLFIMSAGSLYIQSFYMLPEKWAKYRMDPTWRLAEGGIVFACGFLGSALIAYNKSRETWFDARPIWFRILHTILGIAGIIIIFIALRLTLVEQLEAWWTAGIVNLMLAFTCGLWTFWFLPQLSFKFQSRYIKKLAVKM